VNIFALAVIVCASEPPGDRVLVHVANPDGVVVLDEEMELPWVDRVETEVDGRAYHLNVAAAQVDGSVQWVSGLQKGSKKKALHEVITQISPSTKNIIEHTVSLPKRDEPATWTLQLTWSPHLSPPAHDPAPEAQWPNRRFFLVWDDAVLLQDIHQDSPPEQEVSDVSRAQAGAASAHLSPFRMVGAVWREGA